MFKRLLKFVFVFSLLTVTSINTYEVQAQSKSSSSSTQQKKADKKKADQKKRAAKADLKAKDHIRKIQTKEVRKRMKKHRKQAGTPYKKPNFFQRMFGKK